MFRKPLSLILIAMLIWNACNRNPLPGENDFDISWEVISNLYSEKPAVKARFTIVNNSKFALKDDNWALYYNQSPREILATNDSSGVRVEHINGDWYRIVPLEGFTLLSGNELVVDYEAAAWWIKMSDAPVGLYFVFWKKDREYILPVKHYSILPFDRPEQLTRHKADHTPFVTPQLTFEQNKDLFPVSEEELLPVVPSPVSLKKTGNSVVLNFPLALSFEKGLEFEAQWLAGHLKDLTGEDISLKEGSSGEDAAIHLSLADFGVDGKSSEAYHLKIDESRGIQIIGSDAAGLFYGMQTLMALLPVEVFLGENNPIVLPGIRIEDAPRFGYRGLHIDVARNFQKKETILKVLDLMAFYKLNVLHFHITDDEGWRLEIPSLPELTQVGGRRGHTSLDAPALHPAYGSGPFSDDKNSWGNGYYSRSDYIEILKYAKQRHITIIPEINMPGHSRAAIKAMETRYEEFIAKGNEQAADEFRLIDPEDNSRYHSAQSFTDNVVNPARESVYFFLETVLDEVSAMYREADAPLHILNMGGDEVPASSWSQSPMINQLVEEQGMKPDAQSLQAYFSQRVRKILQERNLRMAGWEEIALTVDKDGKHIINRELAGGQVIPNAWNSLWGAQDLAYRFANAGFPVILSHVTNYYLDLAYNKDPRESGLYWGGFVKTYNTWHYSPYYVFYTNLSDNMGNTIDPETDYASMERLRPEARKNILGIQAQLWGETIFGPRMLEYSLLPKLIGLAETAWGPERPWEREPNSATRKAAVDTGWNIFANTLAKRELPRLSGIFGGFNYRIPLPGAFISNGTLLANIEFPGLIIRFTTDGQEPSLNSAEYTGPVEIETAIVRLKAFDKSGRSSRVVELKNDP